MWIHEHRNWPIFTWDAKALNSKLADVRHRQGRLLGRMEGLGFELKREACLSTLTKDIVKTPAIEGENLNPEEVRSSIARRLGIDIAGLIPAGRDVEGIVARMGMGGLQERLVIWHWLASTPLRIASTACPLKLRLSARITTINWKNSSAAH